MNEPSQQNETERMGEDGFSGTRRSVLKSIGALGSATVVIDQSNVANAHETDDHLLMTPAMGWNSWNHFGCDIDAELIKETADAMVESVLKDAGYEYVNIDDCWMASTRDDDGRLQPDPERFPNGIDAVADYVHSKGLKLGIYESAGTATCQGLPGSLGYEETDAQSFADWGVDYLKYDNCNNQGVDPKVRYRRMWEAIEATDRPIVKSQCSWGTYDEWTWAADLGANSWRTTGDINASWSSVMSILDQQVGLAPYAKPGHWNDPDMLEVGNQGLSTREARAHFSLWCMLAAPLLTGNDLREMSEETVEILTNEEVLAINQDPMGEQATKRTDAEGHEVWARPLESGEIAVCLFNRSESSGTVSIPVSEFDLDNASAYILRDLWAKDEVATADIVSASVPSHGVVLYRVRPGTPDEAPPLTTLEAETDDDTLDDGETKTVTTTLTNNGQLAIEDVELSLDGPDGWDITAETSPTHDNTPPSKSVETEWSIAVPEDTTPGQYEFTMEATFIWGDDDLSHTTQSTTSFTVPLDPVPEGYTTFASTEAEFGSIEENGTLVINADGSDVYGNDDEYGSLYKSDVSAASVSTSVVKVVSQEATSDWAKAGLMIRNDITAAGSSGGYAIVAVTPGNGYALQWDGDDDGYVENDQHGGSSSYPVWLKLVRDGTTITGYHSPDGSSWTEIGSATVPGMDGMQDIAMFSTSHSDGALGQVEFDEFSVENDVAVSLSHEDDDVIVPGETRQLTQTVTNYTQSTLEDAQLDLQVPSDWTFSATSPMSFDQVAPGNSVSTTWDVSAPGDVSYDTSHDITALTTYVTDSATHTTSVNTMLSVPPAPPTGDVHLGDIDWIDATSGWGDIGIDESVGGNPLTLGGTSYEKGIGTHAQSEIRYYIGGNMSRFIADVGIDDEVDSNDASVQFRVVGDGETLAETATLGSDSSPVSLDVNVSGVEILSLVVTNGGDTIDYDHADWAIARVLD